MGAGFHLANLHPSHLEILSNSESFV